MNINSENTELYNDTDILCDFILCESITLWLAPVRPIGVICNILASFTMQFPHRGQFNTVNTWWKFSLTHAMKI